MTDNIRDLLTRADAYLTATHTARHDVIAEGGRCAGCQLRDDIRAAASAVPVAAPPTEQAAQLTEAERTMLRYALDQAQEHIWSRDGFTDEDQAAVTSLRRLADASPEPPVHGESVAALAGYTPDRRDQWDDDEPAAARQDGAQDRG